MKPVRTLIQAEAVTDGRVSPAERDCSQVAAYRQPPLTEPLEVRIQRFAAAYVDACRRAGLPVSRSIRMRIFRVVQ